MKPLSAGQGLYYEVLLQLEFEAAVHRVVG